MFLKLKRLFLLLPFLIAVACGGLEKIPDDKQDYVGIWQNTHVFLSITPDARIDYQFKKGNVSKSIRAPITQFKEHNFEVGAAGIKTTFVVSKPPYKEEGKWKMVVDGYELIRQ